MIASHVAKSTRKTYTAGLKKFSEFCQKNNQSTLPAVVTTVINFLAEICSENVAYRSAKVYLAAITNLHTESGRSSPCSTVLVKHALKGYARKNPPKSDKRLPVTINLMVLFKKQIFEHPFLYNYDKCMYWCAFSFAFLVLFVSVR